MRYSGIFSSILRFAVSLLALFVAWSLIVIVFQTPEYLLPAPRKVVSTLFSEHQFFAEAAASTFSNALIGGGVGVFLGLLIGVVCAYSKKAKWLIEPYLTVFQSFPREAFFPLMIVWLGFGDLPKIVNAALLSVFPMAVITLDALLNTRAEYLQLTSTWSAKRWQEFVYCRIPYGVPTIIGGIRVALPLALIGAVLGEFLGGSDGLGHIIVSSGSNFRIDRSFAAIVVLAIGGTIIVLAIDALKGAFLKRYFQT